MCIFTQYISGISTFFNKFAHFLPRYCFETRQGGIKTLRGTGGVELSRQPARDDLSLLSSGAPAPLWRHPLSSLGQNFPPSWLSVSAPTVGPFHAECAASQCEPRAPRGAAPSSCSSASSAEGTLTLLKRFALKTLSKKWSVCGPPVKWAWPCDCRS